MDTIDLAIVECWIDLRTHLKAEQLNISYQINAFEEEGCLVVEVELKAGQEHNAFFADYIGDIIIDHYHCEVRYCYPSEIDFKKTFNAESGQLVCY